MSENENPPSTSVVPAQPPPPAPLPSPPPPPPLLASADTIQRGWQFWLWGFAVVISFGSAAAWYVWAMNIEAGAFYAALLLLASTLLLIMAYPKNAKPSGWITGLYVSLEVWKAVLLIIYSCVKLEKSAEVLSLIGVALACLGLVGILFFARRTIDGSDFQKAMRANFFAAICGALYLFTQVAYDLTFALALHDRNGRYEALLAKPDLIKTTVHVLQFSTSDANVDIVKEAAKLIPKWPPLPDEQLELIKQRVSIPGDIVTADIMSFREGLRFNVNVWKEIIDEATAKDPKIVRRVTITGHASDALAIEDGKSRNLALSEERVEETRSHLAVALANLGIHPEWLLRAVSNDDKFSASGASFLEGHDHKLSVEVRIDSARQFELLDYAYFMIYTITTTGYGDIIPMSPRAKFITSLANIFELMFIVVLLNLVTIYGSNTCRAPA